MSWRMRAMLLGRMALISVSLLLATQGCVTIPKDAPSYTAAPAPPSGAAVAYIYRLRSFPLCCSPSVYLDGHKVVDLPLDAYTWIPLQEGPHKLLVDWGWYTGQRDVELTFSVKPDESYFIRVTSKLAPTIIPTSTLVPAPGIQFWSTVQFMPTTEGEYEVQSCCQYLAPEHLPRQ
jgi:hypothetical protein